MQKKAFDKIQHSFLIKTLHNVRIEGSYLNIIKAVCERPTVNIILNKEKQNFQGCLFSPLLFNTVLEVLASVIRQQKDIKGIQIGKEVKLSLFTNDMILYVENPKGSTPKLKELIKEFTKVAGYKINAQKSVAFLYTNNEQKKEKLRSQSHIKLHQKP